MQTQEYVKLHIYLFVSKINCMFTFSDIFGRGYTMRILAAYFPLDARHCFQYESSHICI